MDCWCGRVGFSEFFDSINTPTHRVARQLHASSPVIKTDPKNMDYAVEAGVRRNFELYKAEEKEKSAAVAARRSVLRLGWKRLWWGVGGEEISVEFTPNGVAPQGSRAPRGIYHT